MAVSTSFKQPCPSCEAMVTVKEGMVGKKIECHKCKDRFVAVAPVQKKAKKETASPKKADARVSAKSPPPIKNGKKKPPVEDEEIEELEIVEEDEDDKPQAKAKGKPAANGKSKAPPARKSRKPVDDEEEIEEVDIEEDDVDDEEDEKPKKSKKKEGSNKMTLGLVLAGLGVVVLCIAAYFVLGGGSGSGGRPTNPVVNNNKGGGGIIEPPPPPEVEKTPPKPVAITPPPLVGGPLTDAEIARLSNLLPNDAEHVFHVNFKELFATTSTLRDGLFAPAGGLVDAELKRKMGFSLLAVDDLMLAQRYTSPWSYTVLHVKDPIIERDVIDALDLKTIGAPIEGLAYYQMGNPNPWFETLARFSFGVPHQYTQLGNRSDRPSYVHFYNPQTIIIGDEMPVLAFLKAKGQFPLLTPRGGGQTPDAKAPAGMGQRFLIPGKTQFVALVENDQDMGQPQGGGGGAFKFEGVTFEGKENNDGKLRFKFAANGSVTIDSSKSNLTGGPGEWKLKPPLGAEITAATVPGLVYEVTVDPATKMMTGTGRDAAGGTWPIELQLAAPAPSTPDPMPKVTPTPGPTRGDMFLTINPSLKALMDRMELRMPGDKVLCSSATDMDASRVQTALPEFKDRIVRRPRQFWDVALMVPESTPRIRLLGTSLVQRDNVKYQYRNELMCGQEVDARHIHKELNDRTVGQVARFVAKLANHEIRLPQAKTATPVDSEKEKEPEKKSDATASQVGLSQESNTVQFTLDLVLDNSALTQINALAALTGSAIRSEMEAAAALSLRHGVAWGAKSMVDKGISERGVPEGVFAPGAFKRPDAPLRADREPRNRISWMAGLLPFLGQQNLYKKIQFEQSWRDPGNWLAGRTAVPQFLDPMYPDSARYAGFADLPVDFGVTHYVGIAGVGLDAGAYNRRDPAIAHKRGILGYDESASLEEIRQGRGASNTILMIQVPHDGVTGVSPWIAGGGATLRGVPEKNSIAPFVLSTDRAGKIIQHDKKRGTFAVMADGSVRFIDQNVSDDAFKAMCTIAGPAPKDFDPDTDPNTPTVPAPNPRKAPGKKAEPKQEKIAPPPAEEKKVESPARDGEKKVSLLLPVLDESWVSRHGSMRWLSRPLA